ncbi:MAG: hypothetical protein ACMUIS_05930 [bacterium]
METITDVKVIRQMLDVEKSACTIIDEAKQEANKLIEEARNESRKIVEETKKEIIQRTEVLESQLQEEAEEEINRIHASKQDMLEIIKQKSHLKREQAVEIVSEFLFKTIVD